MKFSHSIEIDCPSEKVVEIFLDPEAQHHFQDGFISKTFVSGDPHQNESQAIMKYKKFELHETIIDNSLPDSFYAQYDHTHTTNTMLASFSDLGDGRTRYDSEIHYIELKSTMMKLFRYLFPGMLKKQVLKWMIQFKTYCESTNQ